MVADRTEPRRWLDVGAGHGHFCLVAKELLPATIMDGVDMAESVEEAGRRGWLDHAYRGQLTDIAAGIEGRYDVVSMFHYLEHSRDPLAELKAAASLLSPGGYLLVEQPDPGSVYGRILGRYWLPWFQPQHLHMLSVENLTACLGAAGLEVVEVDRGSAHGGTDLSGAVWLLMNQVAPQPGQPWNPPPKLSEKFVRAAAVVAGAPLLVGAYAVDQVLAPLERRAGLSNTFRLLARLP